MFLCIYTEQEADLGPYGYFVMNVQPNGQVSYEVNLQDLDWVTADSLAWHLHSGKVGEGATDASQGAAIACGANYTAGHYDPWLKCGPASTAPLCTDSQDNDMPCCFKKAADDYCAIENVGSCEIGDLSGLHGRLDVVDNAASIKTTGLCPECVLHYSPNSTAVDGTATYNTWASLVFHGTAEDPDTRVLCADIELVAKRRHRRKGHASVLMHEFD